MESTDLQTQHAALMRLLERAESTDERRALMTALDLVDTVMHALDGYAQTSRIDSS